MTTRTSSVPLSLFFLPILIIDWVRGRWVTVGDSFTSFSIMGAYNLLGPPTFVPSRFNGSKWMQIDRVNMLSHFPTNLACFGPTWTKLHLVKWLVCLLISYQTLIRVSLFSGPPTFVPWRFNGSKWVQSVQGDSLLRPSPILPLLVHISQSYVTSRECRCVSYLLIQWSGQVPCWDLQLGFYASPHEPR